MRAITNTFYFNTFEFHTDQTLVTKTGQRKENLDHAKNHHPPLNQLTG